LHLDYGRAHSFGNFLTKKRKISQPFFLKKCELLSWPSFGQFCQKYELFVKVRAILRFSQHGVLPRAFQKLELFKPHAFK
jgi:hypothetical protein